MEGVYIMNKKGDFLVSNVVKIIISVVCLVMLIYLMVSLTQIYTQKTKTQQAKATLDKVVSAINKLEEGKTSKILLESPQGWYLIFAEKEYSKDLQYGSEKLVLPEECKENCLCICSKELKLVNSGTGAPGFSYYTFQCDLGTCETMQNIDKSSSVVNGIEINIKDVVLTKQNNLVSITQNG